MIYVCISDLFSIKHLSFFFKHLGADFSMPFERIWSKLSPTVLTLSKPHLCLLRNIISFIVAIDVQLVDVSLHLRVLFCLMVRGGVGRSVAVSAVGVGGRRFVLAVSGGGVRLVGI